MLLFLAEEDFNRRIVRGLRRRLPNLDIVRVQDAGLTAQPDSEVLKRAASENRIFLTHDVTTMSRHAFDRVTDNLQMPGCHRSFPNRPNRRSHRRTRPARRMQSGKRMAKSSHFPAAEKLKLFGDKV